MRKITLEATQAFKNHESYSKNNTMVFKTTHVDGSHWTYLALHGNDIAKISETGEVHVTLAGWNTRTTRERLNGIVSVRNRKGQAYLNGIVWDGTWKRVQ